MKDLQDLTRFGRFLANGDSKHPANPVGTPAEAPERAATPLEPTSRSPAAVSTP